MQLISRVIDIIKKLPYIKGPVLEIEKLREENLQFKTNSCFPAGHYYSPIVLVKEIKERESEIWDKAKTDLLMGIDLRADEQIKLLKDLSKFFDGIPFKSEKHRSIRYHYNNEYYGCTDGIILYSMIRNFKPARIIEIGSGFSSAVMIDTNELFFNDQINLTFIEPNPERLYSLLRENDKNRTTIIQSSVQLISLNIFEELQSGDILFIDSTHVVKTGSDVNYILFEILPVLKSGVLIHFHDVSYPFEYPKEWVYLGRNWNENYFLRAFLMYNNNFEIRLFSDYLHKHQRNAFINFPLSENDPGMNLWIEKR